MRKDEYIRMLFDDNATAGGAQKEINEAIIDCADIALSQMPEDFEIEDTSVGLHEFWNAIAAEATDKKHKGLEAHGRRCVAVSPLRAAEIIAEMLGAKFERASRRLAAKREGSRTARPEIPQVVRLEDLL